MSLPTPEPGAVPEDAPAEAREEADEAREFQKPGTVGPSGEAQPDD